MRRWIVFVFLGLLVLPLVAACGGGEDGGSAPEEVSLSFEGLDTPFAYVPDSATVPTGAKVNVTLTNVATLEHSWVLILPNVDPLTATEEDAFAGINSGIVPGGESKTFSFTAPAPGTYTIVCTIPGHAVGGMVGTLTVTEN